MNSTGTKNYGTSLGRGGWVGSALSYLFSAFCRELSLFPVPVSHCHLCLSLLTSDSSHHSICFFIYPDSLREKVPGRPDLAVERVELHPTED